MTTRLTTNHQNKQRAFDHYHESQEFLYLCQLNLERNKVRKILDSNYPKPSNYKYKDYILFDQFHVHPPHSSNGGKHNNNEAHLESDTKSFQLDLTSIEISVLKFLLHNDITVNKENLKRYYIDKLVKLTNLKEVLTQIYSKSSNIVGFIEVRIDLLLSNTYYYLGGSTGLLIASALKLEHQDENSFIGDIDQRLFYGEDTKRNSRVKLALEFDEMFQFIARRYKTYKVLALTDEELVSRIFKDCTHNIVNPSHSITEMLVKESFEVLKPFDVINFQILDFNDQSSSSGYATKNKSSKWEESKFKYVLHLQDNTTFFNFLMPIQDSSYLAVGNFLQFWFLTFKKPDELNFDGLETDECLEFIDNLSKLLKIPVKLKVDLIRFHNSTTDEKDTSNNNNGTNDRILSQIDELHLETFITSSMQFFNNKSWSSQLSILCKILNSMKLEAKDEFESIAEVNGYSPTALLFGTEDELRDVIKKKDYLQLIKLWKREEDALEDVVIDDDDLHTHQLSKDKAGDETGSDKELTSHADAVQSSVSEKRGFDSVKIESKENIVPASSVEGTSPKKLKLRFEGVMENNMGESIESVKVQKQENEKDEKDEKDEDVEEEEDGEYTEEDADDDYDEELDSEVVLEGSLHRRINTKRLRLK